MYCSIDQSLTGVCVRSTLLAEVTLAASDPTVSFFKALADPNRLRILKILLQGERCVSDICAALENLSQPSVSHHLGVLKQAGLVQDRRDGKEVYYSVQLCEMAKCCGDFFAPFGIHFDTQD